MMFTPENCMKWRDTEPEQNQLTLFRADYIVNWASKRGALVRGHNIVWHIQVDICISQ